MDPSLNQRTSSRYPEPVVVAPRTQHKQTFIILHGRGSNGEQFGRGLLETPIPEYGDLASAFPCAKLVFPTASKRRAQIWKRVPINQWFDNWALQTPEEREELQFEGLRETGAYVHDLLDAEIRLVGAGNVVLWGLSQGCAAALVSLLLWEGQQFAAAVGMCGWLPLRKRMLECLDADATAAAATGGDNDPFSPPEGEKDAREPRQDAGVAGTRQQSPAVEYLRDVLDLPPSPSPSSSSTSAPVIKQIPVFLGHGTQDIKVPMHLGREAANLLERMDVQTTWKQYEGLEHWYSGNMLRDIVEFLREHTTLKPVREEGSGEGNGK